MSNIITVGYSTEGTTDKRFLFSIIKRTFDEIAYECESEIEVYDPIHIHTKSRQGFVADTMEIAQQAYCFGLNVLCVHTDADDISDTNSREHKIDPAFENILLSDLDVCKNLVAVVPVRMSEAWMLADTDLLKDEIGTSKSNLELDLPTNPENTADPKACIMNALNISYFGVSNRRYKIGIAELYQPLGQKLALEKLKQFESYRKFRKAVEDAFKQLNFLH